MRKENITYQDKLNELKLDISHPNSKGKVFVLLEGESDVRLFRKLFNLDNCKVENIPGGNTKVEECVQTLIVNYPLIIGIRDADFIHLEGIPYEMANIFLTDFHDIEMMIVSEDGLLRALISEHASPAMQNAGHSEIRNKILLSIQSIGYLKWLNERDSLGYNFDSGFIDLLSFTNPGVDLRQYISRVLGKSANVPLKNIDEVFNRIALLEQTNPDLLQLCNGHDFYKALSEYLRQVHTANTNDKNIASSCRIAYTFEHYKNTALYQNTQQWAANNNCIIYQ